jgi:transcriptional regulator with XRE-family HTH domain
MNTQDRAREAVRTAMGQKGMSNKELAQAAGVDEGTVGDFLNGKRWPRPGNLVKLDTALGWDAGTIARVGTGGAVPNVRPDRDDPGVLLDIAADAYADLSPEEREEADAVAKASWLEKARQIRRSKD